MSPSSILWGEKMPDGAEVFRTGENDVTRTAPIPAGVGAVILAALSIASLVDTLRAGLNAPSVPVMTPDGPGWEMHGAPELVASLVLLAAAAGLGFIAVALIRARRNCLVVVGPEGIVCQNWRRHQLVIPWSAVRRMVISDLVGQALLRTLAIQYVDRFTRVRKVTLFGGPGPWDIQPLKEAIMRYKAFPFRHREGWFDQHEVYAA